MNNWLKFKFEHSMDLDPTVRMTFPNVILGGTIIWILFYGINQSAVQRYNSLPSLKAAQLSLWSVLPMKWLVYMITVMCGLIIVKKYAHCDPISTRQVKAA